METNHIAIIVILLILSGFATFLYLMKNSAIYPEDLLKMDEDEQFLKNFLIVTIALIIIVITCFTLILTNYVNIVF
jgi:magnesium-transporting ATPase (P-type)